MSAMVGTLEGAMGAMVTAWVGAGRFVSLSGGYTLLGFMLWCRFDFFFNLFQFSPCCGAQLISDMQFKRKGQNPKDSKDK